MQVQTFVGKVGVETLKQMDDHISEWMERHKVEPKIVNQVFGSERHSHHHELEPVLITSIWY